MFDCHCHILPGIDDGSKNVEMSLAMLDLEVRQGVEGIIFTPHFYADMNSPSTFLRRRENAVRELEANLSRLPQVPDYRLGAEVHYFRGMSRSDGIESLCIGNSNYILIDMPFRNCQPQFIDDRSVDRLPFAHRKADVLQLIRIKAARDADIARLRLRLLV